MIKLIDILNEINVSKDNKEGKKLHRCKEFIFKFKQI